jgi:putative ABC transport system permease protein
MADHLGILVRDLRLAVRDLRRHRGFTVAAILALALGIGAGTAVFSVVDRILFRSLPYRQAERLVSFGMVAPIIPQEFLLGYDFYDWRDAASSPFEAIGAWSAMPSDCDFNDTRPARLRCLRMDSNLLKTLGTPVVAGREFTRQDERPGGPRIAIVSNSLWRSRLGADPAAIGKTIRVDGQDVLVTGVLPAQFELPNLERPDIVFPQVLDDTDQRARRATIPLYCVGRLKSGVTQQQALAALQPLFQQAMQAVPAGFRKDVSMRIRDVRDRQIHDARVASWVLLGSVLAVLLIACANVANLLLARAAARERDAAIRMALGAGRGRLVRQALTESALLAVAGGVAGCALAFALLRVFTAMAPEGIPRLREASLDPRILLFTLAVSLLSGLLFGLAPALYRPRVETLGAGRSAAPGGLRMRQVLVAAQIGVSLVLLTGAGLLLRSLWNLQNQPLGIQPEGALTATVTLGRTVYPDPAKRLAFFESLEQGLRAIPGVTEVAVADSLPPSADMARSMLYGAINVRGRAEFNNGTGGNVTWRSVTPDYFSLLRIPLRRGRVFTEADRSPDQNVVVFSESLARRMFPGQDAIGQQVQPSRIGPWRTVVGVVDDVKNNGLLDRSDPEFYVPRKHVPDVGYTATAIVRSAGSPAAMAPWVRSQVSALDPALPVAIDRMEQRIGKLAERPRFNAVLLGLFASVGLLLAAVGLYGVISFLVTQRTGEIGIRMALGATPADVRRLVLRHAAAWTAGGAALGIAGSLAVARVIDRLLFNVSSRDPWTLVGASAMLFAIALAAAWIPSRRASRVDPMQALRGE